MLVALGSGSYTFAYPSETFAAYEKNIHKLSTRSTLHDLLAHEDARAILEKHTPRLLDSRWLDRIRSYSLSQIALHPAAKLTDETLDAIDEELAAL